MQHGVFELGDGRTEKSKCYFVVIISELMKKMQTLESRCRCTLLFFVVRPGDLVVAEGTLQLLYRHRMVCFPKALKNE